MKTTTTHRFLASVALLGALALTQTARAQDPQPGAEVEGSVDAGVSAGRYPVPNAARPLTLSEMTLRIDAQLGIGRATFCGFAGAIEICVGDTFTNLSAGAGFGITEDLEVGAAYLLPIQLTPDAEFLNPRLYGRYRFLRGDVEIGAQLGITIPFQGDFGFDVGLPVWVHFSPDFVLRTGLVYTVVTTRRLTHALTIPLQLVGQATPEVFIGGGIDPTIWLGPGDPQLGLALSVYGGYTFASGGAPIADVQLGFSFPQFVQTGGNDAFATNIWQVLLTGRIFVFL